MMAGSIEGRMPFMDIDMATLVSRFPDKFLVGKAGGKVLRAAMNKNLSECPLMNGSEGLTPNLYVRHWLAMLHTFVAFATMRS